MHYSAEQLLILTFRFATSTPGSFKMLTGEENFYAAISFNSGRFSYSSSGGNSTLTLLA